jgi:hypothetical protein
MGERIKAHLGTGQVGRVIYGAIIGMSVVVVLDAHPPAPGSVVASLVATALAVCLAELYSDVVATEHRTRRRIRREHLREIASDAGAVAFGVVFPSVFFILAAVDVIEDHTAFTAAKWSGVGLIGFYGFSAGRLAGSRWTVSLLQGLAAGAIGGVLILFKALVH